jgi:hypothetical protein
LIKRIMLLFAAVALLAVSLAPVVQAQAGAPTDVDETPFVLKPRAVFGNCAFPVEVQFSGKGKQINLPDGSFIATSPGLKVTLTNTKTGTSETFSISGSFDVTTDPETGNVTTVSRGTSLLGDPEAGFVVATGNFSFVLDAKGKLVEPLSGEGELIDVCEALA